MKNKSKQPARMLRKLLGRTQAEFAVLVGASKDAVVSWENGRNPLSATFARRIALATGVDESSLLRGSEPLLARHPFPRRPYTEEDFQRHRKTCWGDSAEENARRQLRPCADALELLFRAAAKASEKEGPARLPGLVDSFRQWCEEIREDLQLDELIEAQLAQRKSHLELNHSYEQWREIAKTDPDLAHTMGFKDDPQQSGEEMLRLSLETVPVWRPGRDMRGGRG